MIIVQEPPQPVVMRRDPYDVLTVRDSRTGRIAWRATVNATNNFKMTFSPDQRWLLLTTKGNKAVKGYQEFVTVFDARSGRRIGAQELGVRRDASLEDYTFSFARNAPALALVSKASLTVWRLDSRSVQSFARDLDNLIVSISPNGSAVAGADGAGTVRVWATDEGRQVARLSHSGRVRRVTWSDDGRVLATIDTEGAGSSAHSVARAFLMDPSDLVRETCVRLIQQGAPPGSRVRDVCGQDLPSQNTTPRGR
jgi:WD40 repeat protein